MKINCVIKSTYFFDEETYRAPLPTVKETRNQEVSVASKECADESRRLKSRRNKIEREEVDKVAMEIKDERRKERETSADK